MVSVPFEFVLGLALEFGCVDCFWRESDRSFTGFVAEVWFDALPSDFAVKWSAVVGYAVKVRVRYAHSKGVRVELHWLTDQTHTPEWMSQEQLSLW